jgi:hypothetical protein
MTLVELRKLAIRKRSKVRFMLRNGMECVVSEDGIARVPELKAVPDFNLEEELAGATAFTIETVPPAGVKNPAKVKPQALGRAEMTAMVSASPAAVAAHDDHDDE